MRQNGTGPGFLTWDDDIYDDDPPSPVFPSIQRPSGGVDLLPQSNATTTTDKICAASTASDNKNNEETAKTEAAKKIMKEPITTETKQDCEKQVFLNSVGLKSVQCHPTPSKTETMNNRASLKENSLQLENECKYL